MAIARALLRRPPVICADEPTGALDSDNGAMVVDVLRQMSRQGCTVVIATHNDDVRDACDAVLDLGPSRNTVVGADSGKPLKGGDHDSEG